MSHYILLALFLVVLSYPATGDLFPLWPIACLLGYIVFDCAGGVRITSGEIWFRNYLRFVKVPVSSVASINAYRDAGPSGTYPVVTLKLKNGSRVPVRPMATISMEQARRSARELAALIDAVPPTKGWDGR